MTQTSGCEGCSTGSLACEEDASHKEYHNSIIHNFIIGWYCFNDFLMAWIMQCSVVSFAKDKFWKDIKGSRHSIFFGPMDTAGWCK